MNEKESAKGRESLGIWRRIVVVAERNLLAIFQRIGRIDHDGIAVINAFENFDAVAEVPADGQLLERKAVIRADDGRHGAFGTEEQGVDGQREALPVNCASKCTCAYSP